jgi:dipeptidyl aminopeptidase/acylaminoacyl peptidase
MRPSDVYKLTGVSDPRISPDGSEVAYVSWRVDAEENSYPSAIWVIGADGEHRRITEGVKSDRGPRWSPDGRRLTFVSNRDGDTSQLYMVGSTEGEPEQLTTLKEDVEYVSWSPDGSQLLFTSRERDDSYEEEDDKKREPRRLTRLQHRLDNVGWTADRLAHVLTIPADGSSGPHAVTKGDHEDSHPAWSPDGKRIAFSSARHEDWDLDPIRDLYVVDADGGHPTVLTHCDGISEAPAWSADGTRIAFRYTPGRFDEPRHGQIAVIDVESRVVTVLTSSLDRNCAPFPEIREPIWDGADVVFAVEDRGNTHLYRVAADGSGEPRLEVGGELNVTAYDAHAGRLVHVATTLTAMPELFEGDEQLTAVTEAFAEESPAIPAERFDVTSADGTPVDAWVMRPTGAEDGKRYPVLLSIHGGPYSQYGNRYFDEFQVYAAAGYVVLFANPRGSSGSSEADARAIRGPVEGGPGWGTVDYEDLMAVVDTAVDRFGFCDPERVGVIGGSYGGFMTSWMVGHTSRFSAACSERAVNNWHSMNGTSDVGWFFKGYFGAFAHEAVDAYLKHSPITYAENITAPLLILHSEVDLRCPVEQAEQMFTTLRLLKKDVEFVRFPGEGHELSRSGSPVHRVQRFEIILDWFDRKLKNSASGA